MAAKDARAKQQKQVVVPLRTPTLAVLACTLALALWAVATLRVERHARAPVYVYGGDGDDEGDAGQRKSVDDWLVATTNRRVEETFGVAANTSRGSTWEMEEVSWSPKAFQLRGFLSPEECDHIIDLAESTLQASKAYRSSAEAAPEQTARTSEGTTIYPFQTEVVRSVIERLSLLTAIPVRNVEGIQVLRYSPGQNFVPHMDAGKSAGKAEIDRLVTVLLYLNDVDQGGETHFPLGTPIPTTDKDLHRDEFTQCASASEGVYVKPRRGNGLLFHTHDVPHHVDEASRHEGCSVGDGHKWVAAVWMHKDLNIGMHGKKQGLVRCQDETKQCAGWAQAGQCDIMEPLALLNCRQSCGIC